MSVRCDHSFFYHCAQFRVPNSTLTDGFPRAEVIDDRRMEQSDDAFDLDVFPTISDTSDQDADFDQLVEVSELQVVTDQATLRGTVLAEYTEYPALLNHLGFKIHP